MRKKGARLLRKYNNKDEERRGKAKNGEWGKIVMKRKRRDQWKLMKKSESR